MQYLARRRTNRIAIEYLFHSRKALPLMRDLFSWGKYGRQVGSQHASGKRLQLLAKDDGIRTTGLHKLHLLRRKRLRNVNGLVPAVVEFLLSRIDRENRARSDRVCFFQYGLTVIAQHGFPVSVHFLDPVFQVDTNSPRNVNRRQKDG